MNELQTQVIEVLESLNEAETRCTYNALGEFCGADLRTIINCLGDRRPLASWIVNRNTLEPTHYQPHQEHPNLYKKAFVIDSVQKLEAFISGRAVDQINLSPHIGDSPDVGPQDIACYGVDGCKGGWLYAALAANKVNFGTVVRIEDLVGRAPPASRIFVDIPIGLRNEAGEARLCDQEARRLLSPHRSSSVFNAPIRSIISVEDYSEANATSKRLSGKGLSKQSFNITPKIREVDQLMVSSEKARGVIREVHPEVCFYGLAGGYPMHYSKKTKEGFEERLNVLLRYQPGIEDAVESALSHYPRGVVAADDILDALVCAVTARLSKHWRTVPDAPELDSKGLPMEMVYCEV